MKKNEVKSLLNQLLIQRIILKNSDGFYEVPDAAWLQLPNLPDFRALKSKSVRQKVESHFSSPYFSKTTLEVTCCRLFTQKQIDLIRANATLLVGWAGTLPDEPGAKPFNFIIAANIATFGNTSKKLVDQDRTLIEGSAWGEES